MEGDMAYRMTCTDKWSDAWFSNLRPNEKLLFVYLYENCDIAGFIEMNIKRWSADLGFDKGAIEGAMKGLGRGLIYSNTNDCIYIRTFLKHQKNLPLIPEKNPAHRGILRRFDEYKTKFNIIDINEFIEGACKGLGSPIGNGNGNSISYSIGKDKKRSFDFSFVSEQWLSLFTEWINYKKARNENYKTQQSLEACYRNLLTLSNNDLSKGRLIIDQAMGNNWQGLFPLKVDPKQSASDPKMSTKYIRNE